MTTSEATTDTDSGERSRGRILMALTNHAELGDTGKPTGFMVAEAAEPWAVFTGAGYRVDLVSPQGGRPPQTGFDPDDVVQARFVRDAGDQLEATLRPDGVDPADYDAVFFAGGHGTVWDFPADPGLRRLARSVYEAGGVISAVCHGPAALTELTLSDGTYLVDGRNVAGFSNSEEVVVGLADVVPFLLADRLAERGARVTHAADFQPHVVRDDRLVTGQNPASSTGVAEQVVAALADGDTAGTRPAAGGAKAVEAR